MFCLFFRVCFYYFLFCPVSLLFTAFWTWKLLFPRYLQHFWLRTVLYPSCLLHFHGIRSILGLEAVISMFWFLHDCSIVFIDFPQFSLILIDMAFIVLFFLKFWLIFGHTRRANYQLQVYRGIHAWLIMTIWYYMHLYINVFPSVFSRSAGFGLGFI